MYKFYDIEDINDLHLEPTTKCNAACPMCLRNQSGDRINNKLVEQDFDLNLLENIDMNIKKLTLAGNYGDPILSNKLFHIIKWFKDKHNGKIVLQTNGGARKADWWKELANIGGDNLRVIFGIDGLEDTNHLYRRNVRWNILMKNVKSYIEAGGQASWKFLVFKHNEHQIENAEQLSKDLGFKSFQKLLTNRFLKSAKWPVINNKGKTEYYLEEQEKFNNFTVRNKYRPKQSTKQYKKLENVKIKEFRKMNLQFNIDCYAKRDTSVYVAADGRVYPCCNTGYHYNITIDEHQKNKKFISLKDKKLSKIVNGDFFEYIENKWDKQPLKICAVTCNLKRDNLLQEVWND